MLIPYVCSHFTLCLQHTKVILNSAVLNSSYQIMYFWVNNVLIEIFLKPKISTSMFK